MEIKELDLFASGFNENKTQKIHFSSTQETKTVNRTATYLRTTENGGYIHRETLGTKQDN